MSKSQISNDLNLLSLKFSNISDSVNKVFDYFYTRNLDFFFKWCFIFITIGIYVTCLVLFLKADHTIKADALNAIDNTKWYFFLFEVWYFVPILTISFILLLILLYNSKISIYSYLFISLVFIFLTLSIYYSYNTLWVGYKNNPVIMYSLTLLFIILLWFSLGSLNNKTNVTLLLLPIFIFVVFGIILGVYYCIGDLDIFVLPNPSGNGYDLNLQII